MTGAWEELERPGPDSVLLGGHRLRAGSAVRLWPRRSGDVFDLALAGRTAMIESIEEDMEGRISLAVVVEDDPGRELGLALAQMPVVGVFPDIRGLGLGKPGGCGAILRLLAQGLNWGQQGFEGCLRTIDFQNFVKALFQDDGFLNRLGRSAGFHLRSPPGSPAAAPRRS